MKVYKLLALTALVTSAHATTAPATLRAQTAWLPPRGELTVNPSYTFQTYDEYFFGKDRRDLPFDVDRHEFLARLEYTVLDDLALDFTFGWVRGHSSRNNSEDGWSDTTFGVRYRLVDENAFEEEGWIPTLAVRAGGIIEGSYYEDNLEAPGKGASGFDASLLAGKVCDTTGLHFFTDLGFRVFGHDVPDEFYVGVGVFRVFLESIRVGLRFDHRQSLSGDDVDSLDSFPGHRFPERKEFSEDLSVDLGWQELGGRYFGIRLGHTLTGRNTGSKALFGVHIVLPF